MGTLLLFFGLQTSKMFGFLCFAAVACAAVCSAERVKGTFEVEDFQGFKLKYSKAYGSPVEERQRYSNYLETLEFINTHNAEYDEGKHGFWCGVNSYSDLSADEWKMMTGYIHDPRESTLPVMETEWHSGPSPRPGNVWLLLGFRLHWISRGTDQNTQGKAASYCPAAVG